MNLEDNLATGDDGKERCRWAKGALYEGYHDEEWGQPTFDRRDLFEKLCLEGFQAGLSWITVLKKRERFREVFHRFEIEKVAKMTDGDVETLLEDKGIIRHRGKINAVINNAKQVLELEKETSFPAFLWGFAPQDSVPRTKMSEVPSVVEESILLSKTLKKRGFKFVGPTTLYALMQAMGMVNDHVRGCCCWKVCDEQQREFRKTHLSS